MNSIKHTLVHEVSSANAHLELKWSSEIIYDKFWAHFKVELKLVKSSLGEFWIMGFIWLSYSANDTFYVRKF